MVEVWDVVDRGFARGTPPPDPSAPAQPPPPPPPSSPPPQSKNGKPPTPTAAGGAAAAAGSGGAAPILDATMVDVYKGTNAVILLVDPGRKQTFEYAARELPRIPKELDVLLLVNFRDQDKRRAVSETDFENFMRTQPQHVKYMVCPFLYSESVITLSSRCTLYAARSSTTDFCSYVLYRSVH